jgi:hypothetical protein
MDIDDPDVGMAARIDVSGDPAASSSLFGPGWVHVPPMDATTRDTADIVYAVPEHMSGQWWNVKPGHGDEDHWQSHAPTGPQMDALVQHTSTGYVVFIVMDRATTTAVNQNLLSMLMQHDIPQGFPGQAESYGGKWSR